MTLCWKDKKGVGACETERENERDYVSMRERERVQLWVCPGAFRRCLLAGGTWLGRKKSGTNKGEKRVKDRIETPTSRVLPLGMLRQTIFTFCFPFLLFLSLSVFSTAQTHNIYLPFSGLVYLFHQAQHSHYFYFIYVFIIIKCIWNKTLCILMSCSKCILWALNLSSSEKTNWTRAAC